MRVFDGLASLTEPIKGAVLTIGNFDGVHRGHQQLLAQAGLFAAQTGGPVTVLTFDPHPMAVLAPDRTPPRLTPSDEKLRLLHHGGAEVVVIAQTDAALLGLEPEDFVEDIIHRRFTPTHIVEGPTFGFGRRRRGNPELLRTLAGKFDCHVHIVPPVTLEFEGGETLTVSSSLVRKFLAEGDVRRAAMCLGRPYALLGRVVDGDRRGRSLGFPTANLGDVEQLIPRDGVYAGIATVGERSYLAAVSIGQSQTFAMADRRIEAHLLDFEGDLYGRTLRLAFARALRDNRRFESPDALKRQLEEDVRQVRELVELEGDSSIAV